MLGDKSLCDPSRGLDTFARILEARRFRTLLRWTQVIEIQSLKAGTFRPPEAGEHRILVDRGKARPRVKTRRVMSRNSTVESSRPGQG